ncbi:MAG: hypothetical protein O7G83_16685, partial [Proteobacteria bacterium]|nr:hypothetical protein [Pseudomonadota bacterium]
MQLAKLWAGVLFGLAGVMNFSALHAQEDVVQVYGAVETVTDNYITAKNADGLLVTFEASGRIVSNQPIALSEITAGLSVAFDTLDEGGELLVTHVHTQAWLRAPGTFATRPLRSNPEGTRHLGVITSVEPIENGIRMAVTHEGGESSVVVDVLDSVPILYHNRVEEIG